MRLLHFVSTMETAEYVVITEEDKPAEYWRRDNYSLVSDSVFEFIGTAPNDLPLDEELRLVPQ